MNRAPTRCGAGLTGTLLRPVPGGRDYSLFPGEGAGPYWLSEWVVRVMVMGYMHLAPACNNVCPTALIM